MAPQKQIKLVGQASWSFSSDLVDAAVTAKGGHLAPLRFHLPQRSVEPLAIAPWALENTNSDLAAVLQVLRGDFFCAPFGGNETSHRGETHPPHGETANALWHWESLEKNSHQTCLHLSLDTKVRKGGKVDKRITLRSGHTAIYSRHILSGMNGPMNLGHHAMLKFPNQEGAGIFSTSRLKLGKVAPLPFEQPAKRGCSWLKPGAKFTKLTKVPSLNGGASNISSYPARRGYEDLAMLVHEDKPDFAWSAVTFANEGYVWFALKDPRVLRSTVLWFSNGGRHYAPWNGRHINVMGVEDVTSYFHYGLAESAMDNEINREGYPTVLTLRRNHPTVVNYIMAVAEIPKGFTRVKKILTNKDSVILVSEQKKRVEVPLDISFLYQTDL